VTSARRLVPVRNESGQAMLVVLAALGLMATVPLVVVTTTVNQLPLTTNNQVWNAAYEAAQSGVNDYMQQVDANADYTQFSNGRADPNNFAMSCWDPVSPQSTMTSCSSPATPATNPKEWYTYSVNTSNGRVVLTVSGKASAGTRSAVRTFKFQIAPEGTLDDIYWTNFEQASGGGAIYFDSADVLNGPVFSNDDFHFSGSPTFASTVTSSDTPNMGTPYYQCGSGGCSPVFKDGPIALGASENIITNGTGPDLNPAQTLGCYIAGAGNTATGITITLNSTTLTWATTGGYSAASVQNTTGNPNTNSQCGSGGATVNFSQLGSALFYVNGDIVIGGASTQYLSGFLTLVSTGNITIKGNLEYPCSDINFPGGTCTQPNAESSDNLDALGMIAENNIVVSNNSATITIDAAMVAISDSFYNAQDTNSCPGGGSGNNPNNCPILTVMGSIAQNTRGVVGHLSGNYPGEGYAKNYVYDTSLQVLWPPFFIPPAGATWSASNYEECISGAAKAAVVGSPAC